MNDIRYGYRTLLKNPGFTAVAVLSLALGIGANTAIFSFIDTVLLKTLPVRDPDRLVLFGEGRGRGNSNGPASGTMNLFSWREYQDFRNNNKVFEDVLAIDSSSNRVYASFPDQAGSGQAGTPEGLLSTFVSGNYFELLGVEPEVGSVFDPAVDRTPGASPLAVLSDAFWERRFHRDPKVIGQTFRIGQREYTAIGVARRGFFGTRVGETPDLWLPVTMQPEFPNADSISLKDPQSHFMHIVGRLKPGVTVAQASANINLIYQRILPGYRSSRSQPDYEKNIRSARIEMTPAAKGLSGLRARYQKPLLILMGVVAMVLLIACANVANLLVALGAKRQREIAVRVAVGAGRSRVIRQLITEGIMLSSAAGLLGILIAAAGGRLLVHLISTGPRALPLGFEPDTRVLAFTVGISLLTGAIFGLAPAIRASRVDLISSLKEGKANMASPRRVTFGRAMVVSQVALSLTLLITAGLLLHSFRNLMEAGTGFDRENVLIFKLDTESSGYKQDQRLAALYGRIEQELNGMPGIVSASVSLRSFNEGHWTEDFTSPGINLPDKERSMVLNFVSPAFFTTFHIPLLAGRPFDARDNASAPLVAVIGQTFAKRVFGDANPIGRTIVLSPLTEKDQQFQIVGVARDVKTQDVRDAVEKQTYLPLAQGPVYAGTVAVRINGDPSAVAATVRKTLHSIEPNLPIRWVTTLEQEVGDSLVRERAIAELSGFFAGLALVLSAIGLYGTISFAVARRTNEIGIRMALGAERTGVLGMVLKDAMTLVAVGVAIGLPLSIGAGSVLQSLLYGLSSFDVMSAVAAVVGLTIVGIVAGYLPARRAATVDPMVALRYE